MIAQKLYTICLTFLILFSGFTFAFAEKSYALDVISQSSLDLDTSFVKDDVNFRQPKRIVITPIIKPSQDLELTEDQWFRGIYYYTLEELGFNDLPFHYIVSQKGRVYKGNSGGEERKVSINGIGDDMIVIGYMAEKSLTKFDPKADRSLTDLLIKLCNDYYISPDAIEVKGVRFVKDDANKTASLQSSEIFGVWTSSLEELKTTVKSKYTPTEKTYNVKIDEVVLPSGSVKPGETITVKLKLTNQSAHGLYGSGDAELVATKSDNGNSNFFVNNEWLSRSQFGILGEESALQPFETESFDVKVKAPLILGEVSETFELRTLNGGKVGIEPFVIKLNIVASDKTIVEIGRTETGNLNVRTEASSAATIISEVSTGQRFFQVDDAGNGWIQIELGDGTRGWIAGWYVTYPY